MTSAPYLGNNPNGLESLPIELQRRFTRIASRTQELKCKIDKIARAYMPNVKGYSLDEKIETLTNTQRQFEKAKDYSDDKIELAKQTFESMDVNIRKVDSDLARLEMKIKKKSISATRPIGSQKRGRTNINDKGIKKKSASNDEETVSKTTKNKQLKIGDAKTKSAAPIKIPSISVYTTSTVTSDVVETNK